MFLRRSAIHPYYAIYDVHAVHAVKLATSRQVYGSPSNPLSLDLVMYVFQAEAVLSQWVRKNTATP
jgi:hypothetical protein